MRSCGASRRKPGWWCRSRWATWWARGSPCRSQVTASFTRATTSWGISTPGCRSRRVGGTAMNDSADHAQDARRRWLARLAFLAAAAAIVLLLTVAGGTRGLALLAVGAAGTAVGLVGVWWFLVHRGALRWLAAVVAIAAPVLVALFYVRAGLLWLVLLCAAWWLA